MKNKLTRFLILLLFSLLLVGCWDYTEIELLDFVIAIGVDQVEPEAVVITEMIHSVGGTEAEFEPLILSTRGRTVSSATHALVSPAGMFVFYPHAQVLVVSEEAARSGVLPIVEYFARGRDIRSTIPFLVAKDCTAEEIFNSKPPFTYTVGEHLISLIRLHGAIPLSYPQQVWEFGKHLLAPGISATLPTIQLVHESGDLVPIIKGQAVFKADQMVGWLDGEEAHIFGLLMGMPQWGRFVMDTQIQGESYPITYQFVSNALEMGPERKNENMVINIILELEFDVVEIGVADFSFHDQAIVSGIEEQLAHTFNRRVQELLGKIQREYNSDILGFGQLIRRREPDYWRQHSEDWDNELRHMRVNVVVLTAIVHTGVRAEPLSLGN